MTANRTRRRSLAEELDVEMPLDAAAAKAAVESVSLINAVVESAGLLQSELAKALGLTEGRVSQVVNGDGNVRVSTLARFLRAAGYELDVTATPIAKPAIAADEDVTSDGPVYVAHKHVTCFSDDRFWTSDVVEFSDTHPSARLHEEYTWVQNLHTGESESFPEPIRREPALTGMKLVESESRRVWA